MPSPCWLPQESPMSWPLYFAQSLSLGSPASGVGLCLLWTPQDRVLPALDPASYAVAGNLYSRDGLSFLVRNLLAQPTITALVLCGRDLTGSGAALVALFRDGLDAAGCIVGDGAHLHADIPPAAIALLRQHVTLHDYRDTVRPEALGPLLAALHRPAAPWATAPMLFPYNEPTAKALPITATGLLLRALTVRGAYLQMLWNVLRFGMHTATQHSSDQRELLDVLTIVSKEPTDPARWSYAPWMPFTRASLGERLPDGSYTGYLAQFLQAEPAAGVSYTYGTRLRAFAGTVDQVAAIVADLRATGASRRAVAALWNPAQDAGSASPPCLNLVQARLRDGQLHLTAYFRSHDVYRAWATNAYGLRTLQGEIAGALAVPAGELAILSHSAHIYAHDWAHAEELVAHHYRPARQRHVRDTRGSFVITVVPPEIVVRHYSLGGEHLQTFTGTTARELGFTLAAYIGEVQHALYVGREIQRAELALTLGRPEAFVQDQALRLDKLPPI